MVEVPGTFADVTTEWLNAAVIEGGVLDASFRSVAVEPMHPSKGLIGDVAFLHVTYARGSGPASFVMKLPAANPESRRIGLMLQAYAREVAFYRFVAPHSPGAKIPRCIYAGEDHPNDRWVLLLDAIEADEFNFFDGATTGQANAAVDALARFHSIWWESTTRFDWMPGFDRGGVGGLQPFWLQNLPVFVNRYQAVLPGPTSQWVLDFAPRLSDWSESAALDPLTMVHSDYRIDNLLFEGDQVTMIDWQTTMRGPAAMDLSCFITTSLSVDDRRHSETALVDRYLATLAAHDIEVDRAWFDRSYDENILWWMGQFGNNLAHLNPEDEDTQAALTVMVERVFTAGHDRNVGRLLA